MVLEMGEEGKIREAQVFDDIKLVLPCKGDELTSSPVDGVVAELGVVVGMTRGK